MRLDLLLRSWSCLNFVIYDAPPGALASAAVDHTQGFPGVKRKLRIFRCCEKKQLSCARCDHQRDSLRQRLMPSLEITQSPHFFS
jgi:hypothetical protein